MRLNFWTPERDSNLESGFGRAREVADLASGVAQLPTYLSLQGNKIFKQSLTLCRRNREKEGVS